jgi:hypothetical protein
MLSDVEQRRLTELELQLRTDDPEAGYGAAVAVGERVQGHLLHAGHLLPIGSAAEPDPPGRRRVCTRRPGAPSDSRRRIESRMACGAAPSGPDVATFCLSDAP